LSKMSKERRHPTNCTLAIQMPKTSWHWIHHKHYQKRWSKFKMFFSIQNQLVMVENCTWRYWSVTIAPPKHFRTKLRSGSTKTRKSISKCVQSRSLTHPLQDGCNTPSLTLIQKYCNKCSLPKLINHWNCTRWSSTTALEHKKSTGTDYLSHYTSSARPNNWTTSKIKWAKSMDPRWRSFQWKHKWDLSNPCAYFATRNRSKSKKSFTTNSTFGVSMWIKEQWQDSNALKRRQERQETKQH
jgi:hypothetical protein